MTVDEDDAKSLARCIFLKALKFNDRFLFESNYNAWIYRIMTNILIFNQCALKHKFAGDRSLNNAPNPNTANSLSPASPLS
jgi:hypothetical protein